MTLNPPLVPAVVVTVTVCAPAVLAGDTHVAEVVELTETLVAAVPPTETVMPDIKFVPVSVKDVPPAVDSVLGDTPVSVGTA